MSGEFDLYSIELKTGTLVTLVPGNAYANFSLSTDFISELRVCTGQTDAVA